MPWRHFFTHWKCQLANEGCLNLSRLPANSLFGTTQHASNANLIAWNDHEQEQDVSDEYFINHDNKVMLIKSLMPAMLTRDEKIIQQDCLCSLMQELKLENTESKKAL